MDGGRKPLPVGAALALRRRTPSPKAQRATLITPRLHTSVSSHGSACAEAGISIQGNTQKQSHQRPLRTSATVRAFPSVPVAPSLHLWAEQPVAWRP